MNNETVRDYIASVMRHLPRDMRRDIEKELDVLISDMLEKRCGDVLPAERDVKVVLAELGEPWELAAEYNPGGNVLIGHKHYRTYILVLGITVISFLFGITLASILELFQSGDVWYAILAHWLVSLPQGLLWAFGIVTFIFAVLERATQRHKN